ncbi:MAG: hypothetical protein R3B96_08075 [Pirellulaceae bacterium]
MGCDRGSAVPADGTQALGDHRVELRHDLERRTRRGESSRENQLTLLALVKALAALEMQDLAVILKVDRQRLRLRETRLLGASHLELELVALRIRQGYSPRLQHAPMQRKLRREPRELPMLLVVVHDEVERPQTNLRSSVKFH